MTALTLVATPDPAPQADCLDCAGHGIRLTPVFGRTAPEPYVSAPCPSCGGTGLVDGEAVTRCEDGCGEWFWTGTGCGHLLTLCPGCSGRCIDCVVEARAEAGFAALRDAVAMAGGR